MSKILVLMGKSSTGKDTIFKKLLDDTTLDLKTLVPYTTRPVRVGEKEGIEYHFTDEAGFIKLKEAGKVIEDRAYHTFHGIWRYFTVDDGQINQQNHYLMIGTLEAYMKLQAYFGRERILPILVELDDGIRLQRALDREKQQEHPRYEEMCRRFLADSDDFSEDKIRQAQIAKTFVNNDLEECVANIKAYILDAIK